MRTAHRRQRARESPLNYSITYSVMFDNRYRFDFLYIFTMFQLSDFLPTQAGGLGDKRYITVLLR